PGPAHRLRHRCSSRYLRISPLHQEFHLPLPASSRPVSTADPRLSRGLSRQTRPAAYELFTPNNSGQRSRPTYYRGCWHVVSRRFFRRYTSTSSLPKEVYNPKAFIPHAASLRQAFAHCAIFPTAASRRSLGRVSVPVWPVAPSRRLPVVALVGRYPTNKLIGREPIPDRKTQTSQPFHPPPCGGRSYPVLDPVSQAYPSVRGRLLTCYSPVRRSSTPEGAFPLDLHVLSTPPAFVLSQDQTLHEMPQNPRHSHRRNIPANATRTHTHTKTRKPRAPVSHARNDGVKLTALAFGT